MRLITAPTLTFFCPACSARLTVPASLAGVTGPCPTCNTVIQAPIPTHPLPPAPQPQPQPVQQQPVQAQPVYHPPVQPAPEPAPYHPQETPSIPEPVQSVRLVQPRTHITAPDTSSNVVRVELRGQRHTPHEPEPHPEVVARPISEQQLREPSEYRHPSPPKGNRSYGPQRVLISLAVLAMMGGVAFGLATYLRASSEPSGKSTPSKTVEILPQEPIPKPGDLPPPRSIVAPTPVDPPPPAPVLPPPKIHAGVAAMEVLEKFLSATTLSDRLPLIETSLSQQDLASTVLAKPFPPDPRSSPDIQESNRAENSTDIYYNVDFKKPDGKYAPFVVLLRARGENPPKVIVDPFLDSYGGRLSVFASTPSENTAHFQVVVTAVAKTTSDQKVPNHEQKLWLKLLPRDNEKEIASAYFTKGSKIGQMLTDDASGFRYGQARPARVTLRWNREEDPNMPFLEVVDIKDFRWNP